VATRSGHRATELVDALELAGADVIALPLTEQVGASDGGAALRAAVATIGDYDWVVVTSVNAVERLVAALRGAVGLAPTRVAAVGPSTAGALQAVGVTPDLVPDEHSAEGLVRAFPAATGSNGDRVLFLCADIAPDTVPVGLAAKGWLVERTEAYRTVRTGGVHADAGTLDLVARADAIVFAAPSSVAAFGDLRSEGGHPIGAPPLVVCIGPRTADAARRAGLGGVVEAPRASVSGLVAALAEHIGGASEPSGDAS
jgi:uroporphyrinogen-III synthase